MYCSTQVFQLLPSSAQTLNLLLLINAFSLQLFQEVLLHCLHVSFYLFQFLYFCFLFHQFFSLPLLFYVAVSFQSFSYHFVESIYFLRTRICIFQQHLKTKNFNFFQEVTDVSIHLEHLSIPCMLHIQKLKNTA